MKRNVNHTRITFAAARSALLNQNSGFLSHRAAGNALLIRVAGAAIAFLSQPLLARWMGASEYGIYAYVWIWVLLFGSLIDFGFAANAQRFIPEYSKSKAFDLLRGFLAGSRLLVVVLSTFLAVLAAIGVSFVEPLLSAILILPLYLACLTLPLYGLILLQDGVARSYDWMNIALLPLYIIRPLAIIALMGAGQVVALPADAKSAMIASVIATWATALLQFVLLNRSLSAITPDGGRRYEWKRWVATSLPIFIVGSFFFLLTYVDILVLQQYRPADQVAIYFAATKVVSVIAFIYFSMSAAAAHKFAEYHADGDSKRLADFVANCVRWTFWPSVAATAAILAMGRPILWLFGPEFVEGYSLLFILCLGLLARAAVGPIERLLNMLGEQKTCALVYAGAFAINLAGCFALIPRFGATGAALSTSTALIAESIALFLVTKRRLGLTSFVWTPKYRSRALNSPTVEKPIVVSSHATAAPRTSSLRL
jgi:O-antigen/teichoic acid export membrane protein